MNAGSATIEWLYREQLRVDAEWSVRDATGFTWWADQNAQRIEVVRRDHDPELGESFLIRVRTEVLCDLTLDDRALQIIGNFLMPFASMTGPVYGKPARKLSFSSMVRVHEGIRAWMAPLISMAAVLQVGEARILGPRIPELIGGGRFATSGHPDNRSQSGVPIFVKQVTASVPIYTPMPIFFVSSTASSQNDREFDFKLRRWV